MKMTLGLTTVALILSLCALFTVNPAHPDTSDLIASEQRLAKRCYVEGVEQGRLLEMADQVQGMGGTIPPKIKAIIASPPTAGCAGGKP